MRNREMRKKLFVVDPGRIYGIETVLPLVCQLKAVIPNLEVYFIFFPESDRPFNAILELEKNDSLRRMLTNFGKIVKPKSFWENLAFVRKLPRVRKLIFLLPVHLKIIFSRKSVILFPREISETLNRWMSIINKINQGRSYCYLMAQSSFMENMVQNFDEYGNRRPGFRSRPNEKQSGDGVLVYHHQNLEYLERQGYKKSLVIGYPMMFPRFQQYIRALAVEQCDALGNDREIKNYTILLNKYFGDTSGCDDDWAIYRLEEVITVLNRESPGCNIWVRLHPTVKLSLFATMVQRYGNERIKITDLGVYLLGAISDVVIGIGQSSSCLNAMAFDAMVIDYGRIQPGFYKNFPSGSYYADFGVKVAYTPRQLASALAVSELDQDWKEIFQKRLDHNMDLGPFLDYWVSAEKS